MPSSHSATVCALATAAGMEYGGGSFPFAMAAIFAIVVMYDAMGVRRETGIQAKVLNEMIEMFVKMGKKMSVEDRLEGIRGAYPSSGIDGGITRYFGSVVHISLIDKREDICFRFVLFFYIYC